MSESLKEKAIRLRRLGLSYSEIRKTVRVAKSTLSLWLRSVGLARRQRQRLTEKRLKAALRGAIARKTQRILLTRQIKNEALSEVKYISGRELWLIGVTLYWAEGSKIKDYNPSQSVIFTNSDPNMVRVFLKWLHESLKIPSERIEFEIYIHESYYDRAEGVRKYWQEVTRFPARSFAKIYFKRERKSSRRKNRGKEYNGLLRIRLRRSTDLNRKITGWIEGICHQCGVV